MTKSPPRPAESVPAEPATSESATSESAGGRTLAVSAGAEQAGQRLDRVLAAAFAAPAPGEDRGKAKPAAGAPRLSRSRLQALIREGRVSSGGETISDPDRRVKPGQTFAIFLPDPVPARPQAQDIPLTVVYEDEELIVIDKPAGLVVHPAPGNPDSTLVNALIAHCGNSLSGIGGERRPGIVHRLDKHTSGLMVAAKTDRAHAALSAAFKAREVERAYTALVWSVPAAAEGEIEGNIGRSPRNRKKMAVLGRGGREAVTRYRVVRRYGGDAGRGGGKPATAIAARLECRLLTGRTHQIRVHLTHIGHPLIGDPVYGGGSRRLLARLGPRDGDQSGGQDGDRDSKGNGAEAAAVRAAVESLGQRQALHAHLIGFEHPSRPGRIRFESDLPPDIRALTDSLEKL